MSKRGDSGKRIVSPLFLPLIEIKSDSDAQKRTQLVKKNTSQFYSFVYAGIFGGRVTRPHKFVLDELPDGSFFNFHPDVVRYDKNGTHYTEVKGISKRASQPHCSKTQVSNYAYKLLLRLNNGDKQPSVDYAFVNYGTSANMHLVKLETKGLVKRLSKETNSILVVPLNLAFLLLLNSRSEDKNQETSNCSGHAQHWRPKHSTICLLQDEGLNTIPALLNGIKNPYDRDRAEKYFALEGFHVESYMSPNNLYCREVKIQPFQITRYFSTDNRAWLKNLRAYHKEILESTLHIKDIYGENNPF